MTETRRRRYLTINGDTGNPASRAAHRYEATAVININPPDATRAASDGPSLRMSVQPDGTWTVYSRSGCTNDYAWTIAAGTLDDLEKPASANASDPLVTIRFSTLVEILARETSCLDPSDAPGLARVIRYEAERIQRAHGNSPGHPGGHADELRAERARMHAAYVAAGNADWSPYTADGDLIEEQQQE